MNLPSKPKGALLNSKSVCRACAGRGISIDDSSIDALMKPAASCHVCKGSGINHKERMPGHHWRKD